MKGKQVYIGSDHAGFSLKVKVIEHLAKNYPDLKVEDLGCPNEDSVDYPDYAGAVGKKVSEEKARGILICGSGIGVSIAANKIPGVRAALCWDVTSARLSREHNDANVLCLGSRLVGTEVAFDFISRWLVTDFLSGRHQRRIDKISKLDGGT